MRRRKNACMIENSLLHMVRSWALCPCTGAETCEFRQGHAASGTTLAGQPSWTHFFPSMSNAIWHDLGHSDGHVVSLSQGPEHAEQSLHAAGQGMHHHSRITTAAPCAGGILSRQARLRGAPELPAQ